jgi:hypothetical protein
MVIGQFFTDSVRLGATRLHCIANLMLMRTTAALPVVAMSRASMQRHTTVQCQYSDYQYDRSTHPALLAPS